MMRDDLPDYDDIAKALDECHSPNIKPLYMLIKVEVDKYICWNQDTAAKYANNHCNKMEYELIDHYYPDDKQYPYIAK